jgi:hypothetical protein
VHSSLCKKILRCYEKQQLILGTGTAIWWVTEPHFANKSEVQKEAPLGWAPALQPRLEGTEWDKHTSLIQHFTIISETIFDSKEHHL